MGWGSATYIFDSIMDAVIKFVPADKIEAVAEAIAVPLWEGDWDTEMDSNYWDILEPIYYRHHPWLKEDEDV